MTPARLFDILHSSFRNKKAPDCSGAPGLYPPPGTSPKPNFYLLQRAVAGARGAAHVEADHARLIAEEVTLTSLRVLRVARDRVGGRCAAATGRAAGYNREHVAALGAAREN